jgi:hypothetical protein
MAKAERDNRDMSRRDGTSVPVLGGQTGHIPIRDVPCPAPCPGDVVPHRVPVMAKPPARSWPNPARADARRPDVLMQLARRLDRLAPSSRDPESFHIEKSEICCALRQLAKGRA